ncbi:MAG: HAMP domain-containing protein [Magnetospirillum sp. WYHS-4]
MAGGQHLQQVYADPTPAADYGEQTFLGGMSLSGRVRLFVFLGLAAMVGLGAGAWHLDQRLALVVDETARARDLLEIAGKVERGVWQARDSERSLLADGAAIHAERYDIQVAGVTSALEALAGRPDAQPLADRLKEIGEALARHGVEFRDGAATAKAAPRPDADTPNALVEKAAVEVEARVARTEFAGLRNLWQRVREQEQGLAPGASEETVVRIAKAIDTFGQALVGAPLADKDRRGVAEALTAYRLAVEAALKARGGTLRGRGTARLDKAFGEVVQQVDGLVSFAEERSLVASQKERSLRELVRLGVAGGVVGGLLLLILFGALMMRSIANPVRALANAAPRLLGGDTTALIPALGNHDEIGEVARTLAKMRADLGEAPRVRRELDAVKADLARQMEEEGRLRREVEALQSREIPPPVPVAEPPPPPPPPPPPEIEAIPVAVEPVAVSEIPARLGKLWSGTISTVSRDVALASQDVSDAAFEAERMGTMIRGLTFATARLKEADEMISTIAEQANLLAFKTRLGDGARPPEGNRNLIVLSSDPRLIASGREGKDEDEPPTVRVEAIRAAAAQAKEALREVGEAVVDIKGAAMDLAASTSEEALAVTTRLMEQSQFLRNMLDELVGKIHNRDDGSLASDQPPLLTPRRTDER